MALLAVIAVGLLFTVLRDRQKVERPVDSGMKPVVIKPEIPRAPRRISIAAVPLSPGDGASGGGTLVEKSALPTRDSGPQPTRKFTDEELKRVELLVVNFDGSINSEFFDKFGFDTTQKEAFLKFWKNQVDYLQTIERFNMFQSETAPDGTVNFWIREFPEVGGKFKENMAQKLEGKIPEAAHRYFLDFDSDDIAYTFSNYGKFRKSYSVTANVGGGYTMIEQFWIPHGDELLPTGWRKHEFTTPPPRFKGLFKNQK